MLWPLCAAPLAHLCLPISLPGLSRCKWYPFSKARSAPSTPTPASSGLSNKPAWQCLSPPLSTVARVPDGQAWTQHRPPRRASVKPDQLVAESCTSRKGGQDRSGVSKGGIFEPHQASCSSFKRVDVQAEAQSPSQDHQRVAGGAGRGGAARPRVTVKSCPPLLGHVTRGGHVLLAREGELGWGGQGASAKMQIQFCILLGSSGGASQGAANASLVLKTTARDPVKRLSVWGQSSSGPTNLARSRPSITSWHLTEWLIVSALLGEQMARPCALHPPPPVCLNPSSSVREVQVTPTWFRLVPIRTGPNP